MGRQVGGGEECMGLVEEGLCFTALGSGPVLSPNRWWRGQICCFCLSNDQLLVIRRFGGIKMKFIAPWDRRGVLIWY